MPALHMSPDKDSARIIAEKLEREYQTFLLDILGMVLSVFVQSTYIVQGMRELTWAGEIRVCMKEQDMRCKHV